MRLELVGGDDAKVITASFESGEEVCLVRIDHIQGNELLTRVLLLVGVHNRTVGQDDFIVDNIVRCPTILGA